MRDLMFRVFAVFLFLFCTSVYAQESEADEHRGDYEQLVGPLVQSLGKVKYEKLQSLDEAFSEFKSSSERDLQSLGTVIEKQDVEIDELKKALIESSSNDEMTFEEWTGILLASVAIILTTLAVVIAIVSFYGYKKIINSANDIAIQKSTEVTAEIVNNQIHETTKVELVSLFEDERLDEFLLEAAGKVIYRGISRANYNGESDVSGEGEL